jgi:ATP-dependent helicase/nuclease subunit B
VFFCQKSLIVTPNERQALALWEDDSERQQKRGQKAWETLPVCSWSEFLRSLWDEYWLAGLYLDTPPTLLNEWQERFLWMDILRQSEAGGGLLNLPAASKLASDAWKLSNAYQLSGALFSDGSHWPQDTEVFLSWVREFQARCRANNWLEPSRLEVALVARIDLGHLPTRALPYQIQFCGFAEWTPAQAKLLEALRRCDVTIVEDESERATEPGEWKLLPALDSRQEIHLAARWLRRKLEKAKDDTIRVGLVVPDLAKRRPEVSRLLTEVFQPSQLSRLTTPENQVHDISAGLELSQWPVIADALSILRLRQRSHRLEDWKVILTSPFVGEAEEESSSRALLWNLLCREGRFQVTRSRLMKLSQEGTEEGSRRTLPCLKLWRRLKMLEALLDDCSPKQLPSAWATHFSEVLETYGWPGQRQLDSSEYQTVSRWKNCLAQLGSLDQLMGPVDALTSFAAMRRITDETIYQPKVSSGQVEVMGALEAVGLKFDYLWIAGLHDGIWPAAARPNPYLPFALQRKYGVAHATPERELEFSRRITEQLLKTSPVVVASYPLHLEEQAGRPSPLLAALPSTSVSELQLGQDSSVHAQYLTSKTDHVFCDPGPPVVSEDSRSRGGTSLFKDQAICPFRAFSHHRLNVRPLERVKEGLDGAQRGNLLHYALEKLWNTLGSLKTWMALSPQEQEQTLKTTAESAVERLRRRRPDVLRGIMIGLESERVTNILREWMVLECQREPFEVLSTEEKVRLQFAGLQIQATIDRTDRLADGSLAVIDYKTGRANIKDWLGERPKEPQLPLYCVAHPEPVDTIAFARVRTGDMGFRGLSRLDEIIPGVEASEFGPDGTITWPDRLAEWKERLENLADEFRAGRAVVDPLEGDKSCQFCGLQPLCRVDEKGNLS